MPKRVEPPEVKNMTIQQVVRRLPVDRRLLMQSPDGQVVTAEIVTGRDGVRKLAVSCPEGWWISETNASTEHLHSMAAALSACQSRPPPP